MRRFPLWLLLLALGFVTAPARSDVASTAHNLSVTGPGPVTAVTESEICTFCHIPHNASPAAPLWSRRDPAASYIPYSSSTAVAQPGQPTGSSLLCLSCHDGTIALGDMINRAIPVVMSGGNNFMPAGEGLIGTNLADDHPISFQYSAALATQNGELNAPGTLAGGVTLDAAGNLQCTSCHDAHDNQFGKFLVQPNAYSQLCVECHNKTGWAQGIHSVSTATFGGGSPNPWPEGYYSNVAENGCRNCHLPHAAGGPRLLRHTAEEDNCSACHNGNVANLNVMAEFARISAHPIGNTTLLHDPVESAVVGTRHVECADCHDPHAAGGPGVAGVPPNVRGVSLAGTEVKPATRDYQICLRCHGDSPNQPLANTPRQLTQSNVRLKIQLNNPSFHPIAGPGASNNVPSLIAPLTETSVITCVDCHNSSNAVSAGGNGPEGPHGSANDSILKRQYRTADNTSESAANYALCYGCHSRNSIMQDQSFKEHSKHVQGERAPCNVCHEPHGVSSTQGNTTNNGHLINFDTSVVSPTSGGQLRFEDTGNFQGRCYLRCHGFTHNPVSY